MRSLGTKRLQRAALAPLLLALAPAVSAQSYAARCSSAWDALERGELQAAREGFGRCAALAPESPNPRFALACTLARAGEREGALDELERAVELGYADACVCAFTPELESLRGGARFEALLAAMRRKAAALAPTEPPELLFRHADAERLSTSDGTRAIEVAGTICYLLDAQTGDVIELLLPRPGSRSVSAAFDPTGRRVVLRGDDLRVFDARDGALVARLPEVPGSLHLSLGCDFACSVQPEAVDVWSLASATRLASVRVAAYDADVSSDGTRLAVVERGRHSTAALFELPSGRRIASPAFEETGAIDRCGFSADGALAWFAPIGKSTLIVLDSATGEFVAVEVPRGARAAPWMTMDPELAQEGERVTLELVPRGALPFLASSSDDRPSVVAGSVAFAEAPPRLARCLGDGSVQVLALEDGAELARFATGERGWPELAWDAARERVLGLFAGARLGAFDARSGARAFAVELGEGARVAFAPDGARAIVYGIERGAELRETRGGERVAPFDLAAERVVAVGWSADSGLAAAATASGRARVFEARHGTPVGVEIEFGEPVTQLVIDASRSLVLGVDGARVLVASFRDGTLRYVFDHDLGHDRGPFGNEVGTIAIHPSGGRCLTATAPWWSLCCWDLDHGALLWRRELPDGYDAAPSLAWVAGGTRVLAGVGPLLIDAADGALLAGGPDAKRLAEDPGSRVTDAPVADRYALFGSNPLRALGLDGLGERWMRLELEGGSLRFAASGHVAGPIERARGIELVQGERALPLEACAALLLDPARVRAAAAGVEVMTVALPEAPRIERAELRLDERGALRLVARATAEFRLTSFEVEADGARVSERELAAAQGFGADGREASLELVLPGTPERVTLKVRAACGIESRTLGVHFPHAR